MRILASAAAAGVEVDAFDIHDELDCIPGSSAQKYSESTRLGYNPLILNCDPHTGGVRRQVEFVLDLLNATSRKLGPRQSSALKALLLETYEARGILVDKPETWHRQTISEAEFDATVATRSYDRLRSAYPILRDVLRTCERRIRGLTMGADTGALIALERVEKAASKIATLRAKSTPTDRSEETDAAQAKLAAEKERAIEAYTDYVSSITSGQEWPEFKRYTNAETLRALLERLEELNAIGIFRSNPPRWTSSLRVHQVGALREDDRKLLVYTRCNAILRDAMDQGQSATLRRLVFLDEGHLLLTDDGQSPLNRLAKEGRKYGVGLAIGSQSPAHFSSDFLSNTATVIITGLEAADWDFASRKLNVERETLQSIRAKAVLAVKLKKSGASESGFTLVNVDEAGRR
jgi:hypothetical protein